jgi:paraquat-inducible protein A
METISACKVCGLVQHVGALAPGTIAECCRCGATIREHKVASVAPTVALSLAALIFYVPANIYPILRMNYYGAYSENTVWGGCVSLMRDGEWLVAGIVFLASIAIPFFKLLSLFLLAASAHARSSRWQRERTALYQFIEVIGPWAMLDVFLLAILVALVRLQQLATILPGRGLLAFTAVVVLTILASASFDPRLIWAGRENVA